MHHCKTVQCTTLYNERGTQCTPRRAVPSEAIALNCLMTGQNARLHCSKEERKFENKTKNLPIFTFDMIVYVAGVVCSLQTRGALDDCIL